MTERTSPVFIQSFEASSLQYLRPRTKVRLVQLLEDGDTTADMKAIAAYADGVGPNKRLIVPAAADGALCPRRIWSHALTPLVCSSMSGPCGAIPRFYRRRTKGIRNASTSSSRHLAWMEYLQTSRMSQSVLSASNDECRLTDDE